MRAQGGLEIMEREPLRRCVRLRPRFPFRFRLRRGHLLLPFLLGRHFDEVPHLLKHAAQRRTIRVHDDILMVLETKRLECPLHPIGMAAARSHLLDAQLSFPNRRERSEEHTSELQSLAYLVCRLLLEKKKKQYFALSAMTGLMKANGRLFMVDFALLNR